MNPDPTIRKVVQVAEQAQQPIHVPLLLGNECFIITQQDMRRIEDSRIFSYNKVNSKGELIPMDTAEYNDIGNNATSINTRQQINFQRNAGSNQLSLSMLPEIITRACNATAVMQHQHQQQQQQQQQQLQQQQQQLQVAQMTMPDLLQCLQPQLLPTIAVTPTSMTDCAPTAATLQQQLDWAKACNTMLIPAAMYPLHHTSATSTTEINRTQFTPHSNSTTRQCCTRACNTMDVDEDWPPFSRSPHTSTSRSTTCLCARQQAKQRKMAQFGN